MAEKPEDFYLKRNVARTLMNLAWLTTAADDMQMHYHLRKNRVPRSGCLRARARTFMGGRRELAEAELGLAATLNLLDRPEEALLPLKEGLDSLNELLKNDPENALFKLCLLSGYDTSAKVHESRGQLDEALRARQARLDVLQQLARVWPDRADVIAGLERNPRRSRSCARGSDAQPRLVASQTEPARSLPNRDVRFVTETVSGLLFRS